MIASAFGCRRGFFHAAGCIGLDSSLRRYDDGLCETRVLLCLGTDLLRVADHDEVRLC